MTFPPADPSPPEPAEEPPRVMPLTPAIWPPALAEAGVGRSMTRFALVMTAVLLPPPVAEAIWRAATTDSPAASKWLKSTPERRSVKGTALPEAGEEGLAETLPKVTFGATSARAKVTAAASALEPAARSVDVTSEAGDAGRTEKVAKLRSFPRSVSRATRFSPMPTRSCACVMGLTYWCSRRRTWFIVFSFNRSKLKTLLRAWYSPSRGKDCKCRSTAMSSRREKGY